MNPAMPVNAAAWLRPIAMTVRHLSFADWSG
jgi:hypothetical protein